jgi:hypothetical protein
VWTYFDTSALIKRYVDESAILKHVTADRAYWTLVEVGTDVLAAAEALVAAYPIGTLDAIHVALSNRAVGVPREQPSPKPSVSEADLAFVQALMPHLERAVRQNQRIADLEGLGHGNSDALDGLNRNCPFN